MFLNSFKVLPVVDEIGNRRKLEMSRQMSHVHWPKKVNSSFRNFRIFRSKTFNRYLSYMIHQSSLSFVSRSYSISRIRGFKLEKIERSTKVCVEIGTFVRK